MLIPSSAKNAPVGQLALFAPSTGFSLASLRQKVKLEKPILQPATRECLPKTTGEGVARANNAILAAALENLVRYRPVLQGTLNRCADARDMQKAKQLYFAQHAGTIFALDGNSIPKRHAPEIPEMLALLMHNENPKDALNNAEHAQLLAKGLIVRAKAGGWDGMACNIMKHATVILHLERVRLLASNGDLEGAKEYYQGLKDSLAKENGVSDTAAQMVAERLHWCFEIQVPEQERYGATGSGQRPSGRP